MSAEARTKSCAAGFHSISHGCICSAAHKMCSLCGTKNWCADAHSEDSMLSIRSSLFLVGVVALAGCGDRTAADLSGPLTERSLSTNASRSDAGRDAKLTGHAAFANAAGDPR